ncbi:hypothetical protein U9M48_002067 [Paspalum notatum var. saurae]|uniref:F-box domain-containing protein n=1 Tax=Paspalum notatum var. saurae TaxID=547442 RepID=A0AAQ3PIY4_PASNO
MQKIKKSQSCIVYENTRTETPNTPRPRRWIVPLRFLASPNPSADPFVRPPPSLLLLMGDDRCRRCSGEDRISGLPDDLLHSILLCLGSTRAAARTSVLSRRWRAVWAHLPELVLDYYRDDAPPPAAASFLDTVDGALAACSSAPTLLNRLFISLSAARRDHGVVTAERVAPWLRFAAERVAGELYIGVPPCSTFTATSVPAQELELPLCSRAKAVTLGLSAAWKLRPPSAAGGLFTALTELTIMDGRMEGIELAALVRRQCPCLKDLELLRITLVDACLAVSIRSHSLRSLCLSIINTPQVEIVAPRLEKLCVAACGISARISAPKLAELVWHDNGFGVVRHQFGDVSRRLRLLQITGDQNRAMVPLMMRQFDEVDELKLHISIPLRYRAAIEINKEEVCKKIRSMYQPNVDVEFYVVHLQPWRRTKCSISCKQIDSVVLNSLEEVEISGFTNFQEKVEFLEFLFRNAAILKKLVINYKDHHDPLLTKNLCEKIRGMCQPNVKVEFYVLSDGVRLPELLLHYDGTSRARSFLDTVDYALAAYSAPAFDRLSITVSSAKVYVEMGVLDLPVWEGVTKIDLAIEQTWVLRPPSAGVFVALTSLTITGGCMAGSDLAALVCTQSPRLRDLNLDLDARNDVVSLSSDSLHSLRLLLRNTRRLQVVAPRQEELTVDEAVQAHISAPKLAKLAWHGNVYYPHQQQFASRSSAVAPLIRQFDEVDELRLNFFSSEDRISLLPDELLHDILVRLRSAGAAARTSVLSRRWQHVWAHLPELVLLDGGPNASSFLNTVDGALAGCSAPTLDRLSISLTARHGHGVPARRVQPWLRFASKRVGEWHLQPPFGGVFAALTSLTIKGGRMAGSDLTALVCTQCQRLRDLALSLTLVAPSDVSLRSDSLHSLGLDVKNAWRLEIVAPRLEELTVDDAAGVRYSCPPACPCRLEESRKIDGPILSSLEEVEISDFTDSQEKHEFLQFLSSNATILKKLILNYTVHPAPPLTEEVCKKVRSMCRPNVVVIFYMFTDRKWEDRISGLLDDLLHAILVRLGCARAAARTSVLSRRWRHVWAHLPELVLVDGVLDTVDGALAGYSSAPALDLLSISLTADHDDHRVGSERVVGELYLCLDTLPPPRLQVMLPVMPEPEPPMRLPFVSREVLYLPVSKSVTKIFLRLQGACRLWPPAAGVFAALTSLTIKGGSIAGSDLTTLVCTQCPRLRELNLSVELFADFHDVSLRSDSLHSLWLDIRNAWPVEVVAPRLEELIVDDDGITMVRITSAPNLAKLVWCGRCVYGDLRRHEFADVGRRLRLLQISRYSLAASLIQRFDEVDELQLEIYIPWVCWQLVINNFLSSCHFPDR